MSFNFLSKLFAIYFLTHIPNTLLIGAQTFFASYYPQVLRNVHTTWCQEYGDKLMANPPIWLKSFIAVELILQVPFFIFAFVHLWRVNESRGKYLSENMSRLLLIYGAHVCTTMIAIFSSIMFDPQYRPDHTWQQATIAGTYLIYFIIPLWIIIYVWRHQNRTNSVHSRGSTSTTKKNA